MGLTVHFFSRYLISASYPDAKWSYYHATKFIKALKPKGGKEIKGYAWMKVRGKSYKLEESNRDIAVRLFAEMAADYLSDVLTGVELTLVAIPNSKCDLQAPPGRTHELVEAIAAQNKDQFQAVDAIRWSEPLRSAHHEDGPRFPDQLYPYVRLNVHPPKTKLIVLVDDTMTSSGHMRAVEAYLRELDYSVVLGVVAGRAIQELPEPLIDALEPGDEEIEAYRPPLF